MDKPSQETTWEFLPSGNSCEKCNTTADVQKFEGSYLCKNCRNQLASIK